MHYSRVVLSVFDSCLFPSCSQRTGLQSHPGSLPAAGGWLWPQTAAVSLWRSVTDHNIHITKASWQQMKKCEIAWHLIRTCTTTSGGWWADNVNHMWLWMFWAGLLTLLVFTGLCWILTSELFLLWNLFCCDRKCPNLAHAQVSHSSQWEATMGFFKGLDCF